MDDGKKMVRNDEYFNTTQIKSGIKRHAVRGGGITVIAQILIYCIQLCGTVVLARLLSPDDFGLVAMVTAFSILLQNFGIRGFTEATIQSEMINHKKISSLFYIHVTASVVLMLLFISISSIIAWFYKEPRLEAIANIIAISIILNALATQHLALLTRNMQFYKIAANEIIATLIATIISIALAWYGCGYWALVARRVLPILMIAIGAWILCDWVPGLHGINAEVKTMLKFGMNTYGNFATNYLSRNLDKILIGWRYGAQSLGYYERAYYLFTMPVSVLSYPLTNVAVATLSRIRDEPEKYRSYYLNAISILAFIGMPLGIMMTLVGKDLILLLLGSQWNNAGEIFSVFGAGVGILLIYGTHGWLHLSLGRADRWFYWGIIELIISCLSFFAGLPFGAIGVAFAYTISFYLLIIPGLWYAGKPIQLRLFSLLSAIWKYYLTAAIAGLFCWFILYSFNMTATTFLRLGIFNRIAISIILYIPLYLFFIFAFYQSLKPIQQLKNLLYEIYPKFFQK